MKKWKPKGDGREFFWFTSGSNRTAHRMVVDPQVEGDFFFDVFRKPGYFSQENPIRLIVRHARRAEDLPFVLDSNYFVSDRLKCLLETFEPEGLDFLPTILEEWPASAGEPRTYWALQTTHVVECHNVTKSEFNHEKTKLRRFYIDPYRVPENRHLFHAQYDGSRIIVSGEVRVAMEADKMIGCQFFSTDPVLPLW